MASGVGDGRVAIYWDFDNLACSVRGGPADVGAIAAYAATFGTVVISRAYANWVRHTAYQDALHTNAVDLVQLFEVANTKNGADIRIAADAVSDRFLHPDLTHVIVVSSDSDFTGLARRLREMGTIVIGIGAQTATDAWRCSCNAFTYYSDLLSRRVMHPGAPPVVAPSSPTIGESPTVAAHRALLASKAVHLPEPLVLRRFLADLPGLPASYENVAAIDIALRAAFAVAGLDRVSAHVPRLRGLFCSAGIFRIRPEAPITKFEADPTAARRLIIGHLAQLVVRWSTGPVGRADIVGLLFGPTPTQLELADIDAVADLFEGVGSR